MPIVPIDAQRGLHQIIASVRQLSYMKQHSQTLLDTLESKLQITYDKAPLRRKAEGQKYELQRLERRDPSVPERLLEKLIWQAWGYQHVQDNKTSLFGDVCHFIRTYQMP